TCALPIYAPVVVPHPPPRGLGLRAVVDDTDDLGHRALDAVPRLGEERRVVDHARPEPRVHQLEDPRGEAGEGQPVVPGPAPQQRLRAQLAGFDAVHGYEFRTAGPPGQRTIVTPVTIRRDRTPPSPGRP